MFILNVANSSVTSSTQRRMSSIYMRYSTHSKLMFSITLIVLDRLPNVTPANIHIPYLHFWKLESSAYILPLIIWVYLSWNGYGGLRKSILFQQE